VSTEARTEDQVDETARLAALHRYDLLDTPPDQSFDRLTAAGRASGRGPAGAGRRR